MTTTATRKVSTGNAYAAPTAKQLAYAEALAHKAGYRFGIAEARRAKAGRNIIGDIKRDELSALIEWMLAR